MNESKNRFTTSHFDVVSFVKAVTKMTLFFDNNNAALLPIIHNNKICVIFEKHHKILLQYLY